MTTDSIDRRDNHHPPDEAAADPCRRAPGRPRSEKTRCAILSAAAELMMSNDYRAISIERIAAQAKVGKQSIYRWWPTRADLILDAFAYRAVEQIPPPSRTGDAFADIEAFLARFFSVMQNPNLAGGVRTLIAEVQLEGEFRAKFYDRFLRQRRALLGDLLVEAAAHGQVRADADIDAVLDMIYGAFWYRLLSGTPLAFDAAFAREIVTMLRRGIATEAAQARWAGAANADCVIEP